jgi:hypothetical protein
MAERVRFELTVPFGYDGFQVRCLKPLGHLSKIYAGKLHENSVVVEHWGKSQLEIKRLSF